MATDIDWQNAPLGQLVDHILAAHHMRLHRELPYLRDRLTALARTHWMKHPELLQAHTAFHRVEAALVQHLIQEETAGFPLIHRYERGQAKSLAPFADSFDAHRQVHAEALKALQDIGEMLGTWAPAADVDPEVEATREQFAALADDLAVHIRLENDILFPRVLQQVLGP